jgi:hypothetical protein
MKKHCGSENCRLKENCTWYDEKGTDHKKEDFTCEYFSNNLKRSQ